MLTLPLQDKVRVPKRSCKVALMFTVAASRAWCYRSAISGAAAACHTTFTREGKMQENVQLQRPVTCVHVPWWGAAAVFLRLSRGNYVSNFTSGRKKNWTPWNLFFSLRMLPTPRPAGGSSEEQDSLPLCSEHLQSPQAFVSGLAPSMEKWHSVGHRTQAGTLTKTCR